MDQNQAKRLAEMLHKRREALGFSASEVARRAGVNPGTVTRIELAQIPKPLPETLTAIAGVLNIVPADIFDVTGWAPAEQLPPLRPYLRSKYQALPSDAVAEVERFIDDLQRKHSGSGPRPGEDEN